MSTAEDEPNQTPIWPLIVGALAVTFGGFIPLPGIDYETYYGMLGDMWASATIGPVGKSMPTLVLAYYFASGSPKTWVWRSALGVYLLVSFLQGMGVAMWLETLNGSAWGLDVVMEPGWSFRLRVMLAYAAGAALLWFFAKSIDATKRATGALFLLLVHVLVTQLHVFFGLGVDIGVGETTPIRTLPFFAMPLAITAVAVAITRRPSVEWPVKLWRWSLHSHTDVVALAAAATLPGSIARMLMDAGLAPASPDLANLLDALFAVGLGVSVCLWWRKLASEEGPRPTQTLSIVALGVLALLGSFVSGFVTSGGAERLVMPLPLEGESSFTLVLEAERLFEPGDAETMETLLEGLGPEVEVVSSNDQLITLEVSHASSQDAVLRALTPVRLRVSAVLDIWRHADDEVLRLGSASGFGSTRSLAGECDVLERVVAASPEGLCYFAVERDTNMEQGQCQLHCLAPDVVLSSADIQDATVGVSEYDGRPHVNITLTESAAQRFGNFTGDHIQEKLAIVVNGEVMSAPVIQSRIDGGRMQISVGQFQDYFLLTQEANRLAAGLRPGGVQTPWRLRSSD